MSKHYIKKIVAGMMTAAMILPLNVSLAEPMRASAYELLGETTFDHKIIPWQIVESSPARQYFELSEGAVHIMIRVPTGKEGEKWDLQFRHRNLDFKAGHEYKVSFKVKSRRNGMELCSTIGNLTGSEEYFVLDGTTNGMHMGPHMDGNWSAGAVKLTTEWQTFEGVFKPTRDIQSAEWSFQYAKGTKYQGNAVEGDELWFDDMSIDDLTESGDVPQTGSFGYTARGFSGLENNYISVNQLGYYPGLSKTATLGDNKGDITSGAKCIELTDSYKYEIVKVADNTVIYTGETSQPVKDRDSGDTVCKIDFTGFDEPGEYYIRISGEKWRSFPFRISTDIYQDSENNLLTNALNYFYQNRAGTDIVSNYITSGDKNELEHSSSPDDATGFVQTKWQNSYIADNDYISSSSSSKLDTGGGWYSGTDYDKDMPESGIALWILQNMYERASSSADGAKKFADGSDIISVPESGNKIPDILDECKYELDYMAKMKVDPDEKTWGEYAGMYYNSIHGIGFEPNQPDYEHEFHACYSVAPPTFAATLNYAACAAQAARLWLPYDAEYAEELLTTAKEAYEAYQKNWYKGSPSEPRNPVSLYKPMYRGTEFYFYPEDEVSADAYWAACELYITASKMEDTDAGKYFKELSANKNAFRFTTRITGGKNEIGDGSYTLFNSGNTASAGSMSLLMNKELLDDELINKLKDSLVATADSFIDTEKSQGYGIPYLYNGPGYDLPNGMEFDVRYHGFENASNERVLNNMFAMAYAYDITGDKEYLNGVTRGMDYLLGNNSMAFSFITGYGSYHAQNPSNRYWQWETDKTLPQAPDGVIVSGPTVELNDTYSQGIGIDTSESYDPSQRFYVDSVEAWSTNAATLDGNAALAWIVSFLQDEAPAAQSVKAPDGDVNSDGDFNTADLVLLQKWLLGAADTKLADWKAADLCSDNKLDIFDLICMRKKLIS